MAVEHALQATKLLAQMLRDPSEREAFLAHGWEPNQPLVMANEAEPTGTVIDRSQLYFDQQYTWVTVCVFNNDKRLLRFLHLAKQPAGAQLPTLFGELWDVPIGTVATVAESLYRNKLFASRPLQYVAS
ncbi:MAG: hypothetical protein ABR608_05375 [Pseudonocardiaceae bacterium]